MTRPKKTKSGAARDDPVEAAYDFFAEIEMWAVSLGLTVDNTQFAQFREEIIKGLARALCSQLAQQFGLNRATDMRKHLGGISVAARHLAGTPRAADVQSGRQRRIIHSRRIGSFPNAQLHTAFGAAPLVNAPSEGQCLTIKHASLLKRRLRNVLSGGLGPSG